MDEVSQQLLFAQADLTSLAERILDLNPDPAPRFLLLRDVLGCPPSDITRQQAERDLQQSKWVQALEAYQQPDGTWGRFHTQDSRVKSPFPTTEFAIRRGLAQGLDRHSPILQRAARFIEAHLEGRTTWSDPPEKHDDPRVFPWNIRSVSAGMLALIDPDHPLLDDFWRRWAEIVSAAFAGGTYDLKTELAMHQEIAGFPSKRLIPFHLYYPLLNLSATRNRLDPELEHRLLAFLLHKPGGIYYLSTRATQDLAHFPHIEDAEFHSWLVSQEVLARFEEWKAYAPAILNWIWRQQGENGLWDFGKGAYQGASFPLSESWRPADNRVIDCSVKILILLRQYF